MTARRPADPDSYEKEINIFNQALGMCSLLFCMRSPKEPLPNKPLNATESSARHSSLLNANCVLFVRALSFLTQRRKR